MAIKAKETLFQEKLQEYTPYFTVIAVGIIGKSFPTETSHKCPLNLEQPFGGNFGMRFAELTLKLYSHCILSSVPPCHSNAGNSCQRLV